MKAECYYAIERDGAEYELAITGTVQPIMRGRYSGPPELCYPDEGGEVEIDRATIEAINGEPCSPMPFNPDELTAKELGYIEDLLRDSVGDDDGYDPPSDRDYDPPSYSFLGHDDY